MHKKKCGKLRACFICVIDRGVHNGCSLPKIASFSYIRCNKARHSFLSIFVFFFSLRRPVQSWGSRNYFRCFSLSIREFLFFVAIKLILIDTVCLGGWDQFCKSQIRYLFVSHRCIRKLSQFFGIRQLHWYNLRTRENSIFEIANKRHFMAKQLWSPPLH